MRVLLGSIIKYGIQLGYLTQTLERLHAGAHWTAPPASKDKSTAKGACGAGKSDKQQDKAEPGAKADVVGRAEAGAGASSRKVTIGWPDPQVQEQGTSALAVSEDDYPTLDEIYDLAVAFGTLENACVRGFTLALRSAWFRVGTRITRLSS